MSVPPHQNTFAGGTDGVLISTANSGGASGDAFDSVTGTITLFENTSPLPGRIMFMQIVDATGTAQVRWLSLGLITGDIWQRCYVRISALKQCAVSGHENSSGAGAGYIGPNASGFMRAVDAPGGLVASSVGSVAVPVNQWFRLEHRMNSAAGEIEWWWWSNPDSTGAADDHVLATGVSMAAHIDRSFFGNRANTPATPFTVDIGDVAVSVTGLIGPSQSSVVAPTLSVLRSPYR